MREKYELRNLLQTGRQRERADLQPYVNAPITNLITIWIHIGEALVGSVGALAFIFAFAWSS